MAVKVDPIFNRIHFCDFWSFELFFNFKNVGVFLIEFVESLGCKLTAVSDSGDNALEQMLFLSIKLTHGINFLLKIARKHILEISGLLDLERRDQRQLNPMVQNGIGNPVRISVDTLAITL